MMETRAPNGNWSPFSQAELRVSRRSQPGGLHSRDDLGLQFQALSLTQTQTIRSTNEYTEGPMVAPRPGSRMVTEQPSLHKADLVDQDRFILSGPNQDLPSHSFSPPAALSRSVSTVSSSFQNCPRTSTSSTSSGHRLLESSLADEILGAEPEHFKGKEEKLKPIREAEKSEHKYICEDCGRCRCEECAGPRTLPLYWFCGRRCVCSAQDAVDYGTCLCCAKCLFYHCSSDDEDVCADDPCSCSQSHRCLRWTVIGVLSLLLPCMWCYLPAKGCLKLCQCCYDCVKRPGCRCKGCRPIEKPT